ncbi:zinc protease [Oxalobacteraceae bacterium GrIS 2.11]
MFKPILRLCISLSLTLGVSIAGAFVLPKGVTQFSTVEGVTEYRLSNGLKVLLMPDAAKPTVTVNVTYLVGSRFENYGETGMAHLLEHMMFKGTPKISDIDVEFNQRGMRSNATTALDRTNYFEQFEARDDNLHWAIKMEADRMTHANIAKKDLDSEMTVVRNEYESAENSAESVMLKRMQSLAFDWHNYAHATIGNRSDIENVNIQHLQAFYRLYYQPDNAVLIIAGKFDGDKTLAWVATEFGAIPKPSRKLPIFWTVEPTQDGERQFVVRRKGDSQVVMVGYKMPAGLHPDSNALSVAADVLSDNPSGRLYKTLVDTGKAVELFNTSIGGHDPGLMVIGAVVKNGDMLESVKDELVAAIEKFSATPPGAEEMERMKRNYRNQSEKIASDPELLGLELSEEVALGDWRYFFQNRDQLEKLTAQEVADAAGRYFRRDNRVVGLFIPEDQPQRAVIPVAPSIAEVMQGYKPNAVTDTAEVFDPSPENIEKRVTKMVIGGLQVALLPKKNKSAKVSVALNLHWGDEQSLRDKKMIAVLTDEMLMRGNEKYSREQLNDEFAKLKISPELHHFDSTRENLTAALTLIAQVLKHPTFPENEFQQLKKQVVANLESQRSDPAALGYQALRQHFDQYPQGDWRHSGTIDESIALVNAVQLVDLKAFHDNFYGASKGELTIVGDMDVPEVKKVIEQVFGDWRSPAAYHRVDEVYSDIGPAKISVNTADKENGFYLARLNLNMNDSDPQYPALLIANYIFGGGAELNSILMQHLRQKLGLSYGGGSSLHVDALDKAAYFQINAIAAPQNLAQVAKVVREELTRVVNEGFTAEDVRRAKSGFLQQELQSRSQDFQLSGEINRNLYLERSFVQTQQFENSIRALTTEKVNAAMKAWIDPGKLTVVIAGDEQKMAGNTGR